MDRMRSRRPTFKSQPSLEPKAMREDFKPYVEWTEDPSTRILLILLPGFKREEIRVQLDNAGKLLVKGSRQVASNQYLDVDQSFNVPKDIISEKISGRFEDGRLTLIMPKKVVEEKEGMPKATSDEKGKEPIQEEKPKASDEKKKEEAIQKETKTSEEKKEEPIKEMPRSREEKEEPMLKEKPTATEEKQNELSQKEKPFLSSEDYKDEVIQKEKPKTGGEKKDDGPYQEKKESAEEKEGYAPIHREKMESLEEKKKEDFIPQENTKSSAMKGEKEEKIIQKMKSKIREICADKPKEIKKKISIWRGAEGSWLDSGSLDGIMEKVNRNRNVIAVAVAAFSVGFYVAHKLRTTGR